MSLSRKAPSARHFLWLIVLAQFLVQVGAFSLPALLPSYLADWNLSKTEGGWLVGIFFAAYVAAVPILVSLTDRIPTRRIYAIGAGLKAITDTLHGDEQSRAVSAHAAGVGIAGYTAHRWGMAALRAWRVTFQAARKEKGRIKGGLNILIYFKNSLVGRARFERATNGLKVRCSTD